MAKYKAKLEANDTEYYSSGDSVLETLENFPLNYLDVKTKGTLKMELGDKKAERFMVMRQLRMLFASKMRRAGIANNFEDLLQVSRGE